VTAPLGDYVIESVVVLLLVLALAVVVLYAARRAGLGRAIGPIELLARLPLEARRSVYVVRVLDQVLIVGSSEAGLAKLGQLPDGAAAELREAESPKGFASVLEAALRGPSRGAARAVTGGQTTPDGTGPASAGGSG
jgi:flagellar biogenesis protein FliO